LLEKQLADLLKNSNEHSLFSYELVNDDIYTWKVYFFGPENSLYEGGYFSSTMKFTPEFPNEPPKMYMDQQIFHPNGK